MVMLLWMYRMVLCLKTDELFDIDQVVGVMMLVIVNFYLFWKGGLIGLA